ncbi:alpha/beta hydrolase family protein [Macrococcus animalis]|uniref:alpha/beta hydrolase family protein n=1 Tax=Macrococcus animalis TaxID=3395467 RepID=UPI0039BE237C
MAGISMGGYISSGTLKKYPQVKGMICINGSGSFLKSENTFRKMNNREALNDVEINLYQSYDPIIKTPYNNHILLLHGEIDKVVPIDAAKHFYHDQMSNGSLNTKFIVYDNINHTIEDVMLRDITNWLK